MKESNKKEKKKEKNNSSKIDAFNRRFKTIFKNGYFYIAIIVLLSGFLITMNAGNFLYKNYPDLPILHDLILDNIPYYNIAFVYDIFNVLAMSIFFIYAYLKDYKKIPYFIFMIGLIIIARAIFMILTPFASPDIGYGYNGFLNRSIDFKMGVYPSGHVGVGFLVFLFSKGKIKPYLLILTIGMIITLLLARGHYTIDLFSSVIFAYAFYCFGEKYFKNKLTIK